MSQLRSRPLRSLGAFLLGSLWLVALEQLLQAPQATAFHLSFGQRLRKFPAVKLPQQPHETSTNQPPTVKSAASTRIRPIECRNAHNQSEAGICMFSIDCIQNKGVPLSVCKHNYFVGTCCKLPDHNNFAAIVYDLRDTEHANQLVEARKFSSSASVAPTTSSTLQPAALELGQLAAQLAEQATAQSFTTHNPASLVSSSAPPQEPERKPSTHREESELAARYIISSTSLFPQPSSSEQPSSPPTSAPIAFSSPQSSPSPAAEQAAKQPLNSVYSFEDPAIQQELGQMQGVVFANNHQQQQPATSSSTLRSETLESASLTTRAAVQQQQQSVGDQEFTLASASPQPAVELVASSSAPQTQPAELVHTYEFKSVNNASSTLALPQYQYYSASSSSSSPPASPSSVYAAPPVDLVSASNLTQTTTPFTTSLSTALLPNVSSHPYAPTAPPSVQVTSSPLVPTRAASSTLGPAAGAANESPAPADSSSSPAASSSTFGQLYSSQHSAAAHEQRPASAGLLLGGLGGLQAASKIVTGSSSGNALIPGLSGLQSAILSHMPFKIAGLSSGLSSYLQAAMKPTGSRPLLSSNNAPSLQYQQQLQANATKQQLGSTGPAIRFPEPTNATTSATPLSSISRWEIQTTSSTEAAPSAGAAAASAQSMAPHDVAREAQLVCGRPQVSQPSESKKRVARIVGGNQSLFGQWPWMVSLRQWRKGAFLHKCGAALLNENWAITAAHCVENVKVNDLLLRLGEFDVSNQDEPYPYIERRVKSVVSHPNFDPKTFEYDLALIRFAEPIKYERNIIPVCVPSGNDSYVDRMATVIGWGRLYEDGPLPDVIQHVDVPIITNKECEKMYKNAGYIEEIPDMFICAGISKGGRDSCEGDSGGPLTMVDYDGRSYLVGIISWGIGCALPSQPGVYTRITAFSGWINQITASP